MDLADRQDTVNGFGEGLSRAFEIAVTPAVFGALGYTLDRALGILPVLTLVFVVVAFIGMFLRMWYAYDHEMARREGGTVWGASPKSIGDRRERAAALLDERSTTMQPLMPSDHDSAVQAMPGAEVARS